MIGKTVSHYTILEKLGGGGMGVVYKAEDTRLKRFVALKFLPPELTHDELAKERFEQEARAASALDHSNVCTIHEIDETEDGQVFICMAYYDGETLKHRLTRGPLTMDDTLNIVLQVAEGLRQAHEHGIVHRDIKPANVMLTKDGAAKIVDFGLATLAGKAHLTSASEIAGTLSYMSPEQIHGSPLDHRSDLWSLGVTMYEMLTGRLPFVGAEAQTVLQAIAHQEPAPIESLRTGVPAPLAAIVSKCLQKDPEERYQSAADLRADLRHVKHALTSATVSSMKALPPVSSFRQRLRPVVALPVAVVVVAITLLAAVPSARRTLQKWLNMPVVPDQLHIAVLGFTNVGGDPANRAFCDGVTEILSSTLTKLENFREKLWVVPASEVRARDVKSAGEARNVFGVNLAVTGSVLRAGDKVHLTVNLVDAETLRQINSEVIEAPDADLPDLQDRVASATLQMVKVKLEPTERKEITTGGTKVPKAYDIYVQARGTLENYQGENDPERAAELFNQAIALDSGFALAHAGLAQADLESYRKKKDARQLDEAVASARRAVELDDRLGEVYATLGSLYATTGKYEDAVREFKRAIEIQPRNAGAFTGLARTYDALGNAVGAEETFKRAIVLRPEFWVGYTELGGFYYRRGRYEDAEKQFQKAVALTPQNAWAYNNLGAVYLVRGRDAQAREMFERSVAIRPLYAALSNLGTLYLKGGNLLFAATMYEKALVIRGTDFRVWGNLGTAYHFSDQKAKAKEAFAQAVKVVEQQRQVNPRDTRLLIDLAGYYGMLGERTKGLAIIEQVLRTPPTDADSMEKIGESFEDLGEREKAIEWIGKALKAGFSAATLEEGPALRDLRSDARFKKLIEESSNGR
jgi:tetratricopeptide (TPR) repeat protein/TolB-like protein